MFIPSSTLHAGSVSRPTAFFVLLLRLALLAAPFTPLRGQSLTSIVSEPEVSTQVHLPFHYWILTQGGWVADHFAASPLPPGLTLDPDRGDLSGTPTETGDFQIRLEATASSITEDKATAILNLHVTALPNPPWFSRQPSGVYTIRGGSASLLAEAEGSGSLQFHWFRVSLNGVNGETRTPIPDATESVLKLNSVTDVEASSYRLQVSNETGSTFSALGWVLLVNPPQVKIRTGRALMHAGGLIGIDSSLTPGQGTVAFQWRHNGIAIPNQTSQALVLYPVAAADAGTYDLVVTNIAGSAISNSLKVTVVDPVQPSLVRHSGASSLIRFTAIPGIQYTIESTEDAPNEAATWVLEDEVTAATASFSRLVLDRGPVRFYRVQGR